MIAIVAVDDRNGMLFNHRRLSKDSVLRQKILELVSHDKLWMNSYSAKQFEDALFCSDSRIVVDDDFPEKAEPGDFCFFEDVLPNEDQTEKLILFKWNRVYPADLYFDFDLSRWSPEKAEDFEGSSHHMTMEVYVHAAN